MEQIDPGAGSRNTPPGIPATLRRKLTQFRRDARLRTLLTLLFAALLALAISFLITFSLERWIDTPAVLRSVLGLAGAAVILLGLPRWFFRWGIGLTREEQIARRIAHCDAIAGDRILGAIELASGGGSKLVSRSPRLVEAAIAQVDQEFASRDLTSALPPRRHHRFARAALLPVTAVITLAVVWPDASANTLLRWSGLGDVPRYTFARISELPGEWVVPRAEPLVLELAPTADSRWTPETATVALAELGAITAPLREGVYRFELPPQTVDESISIRVGDLVLSLRVHPIERPELVELAARVTLPEYLGIAEPLRPDLRGGGATVVEGSDVGFTARATRELARARLDGVPVQVRGHELEGAQERLVADRTHRLDWQDQHGLTGTRPVLWTLRARPDEPPTVGIRELPREVVILTTETLAFRIDAGDDFGVRAIGISWQGAYDRIAHPHPSSGEKRVAAGGAEDRALTASATFCADRLGIPAQSIELRATARDAFPGREPTRSTPFTVHVLTPEDHMIWMTGELGRWLREAAEVRDRERDLHRVNQELRELARDEIDRPEIRKRIEDQAMSERANGRRLARLGARGDDLVAQAARNPEFNTETMHEWAERVRALREIAENRMPSVAELLAEASSAAAAAPSDPGGKNQGGDRSATTGASSSESSSSAATELASSSDPDLPRRPASGQAGGDPSDGVSIEEEAELARLLRPRDPGKGVRNGEADPSSSGGKKESDDRPPPPGVSDHESSQRGPATSVAESSSGSAASSGAGWVTTTVPGSAAAPPAAGTEAEERLEAAISEQSELLARFDDVIDDLMAVLRNLEGSTFVKRLKAASREQIRISGTLTEIVPDGFGVSSDRATAELDERLATSAALEWSSSDRVTRIQGDLEAFVRRTDRATHQRVLGQMKDIAVTAELNETARAVVQNHSGDSIARAELWADTFDRWADELVGPG